MSGQGQALVFAHSLQNDVITSFFMVSPGFRLTIPVHQTPVWLWAAASSQDLGILMQLQPPWEHYKFYFRGVSLCMKYPIFSSLLGIKIFDWLQRILQKKKKKDNRDDHISLHLDIALNVTEQFTPVQRVCGVILNQTWSILQLLCKSINDSIRCKGNSQPDNYSTSSHALLILITALCSEAPHLPFPSKDGEAGEPI